MLKAILTLISLLPDFLELAKRIHTNGKRAKASKSAREQSKEDVKLIVEAFDEKDPEKLRKIFNS